MSSGQLLIIGKDIPADKLDDFHQAAFLSQNRYQLVSVVDKIASHMIRIPARQIRQVFAVAGQPADGGEMSFMGEPLIQSPEAADETFGILRNRLGEITALRGYRADDGYASFRAV